MRLKVFIGVRLDDLDDFIEIIGFNPLFENNINIFRKILHRSPCVNGRLAET